MKWKVAAAAVLAVLVLGASPARAGKPIANPYPFGKAEVQGKSIEYVVELLAIGDKYRRLCLNACYVQNSFGIAEHNGRESKNWYRAALDREPGNAYASVSIGYVDLILGRAARTTSDRDSYFSAAMARFREALEKRPGYGRAYLYMAQVQALRQEYTKAEKNLELILNSDIAESETHSWMAYVLIKTNRKKEAQKHIARAIELDDPSESARWCRDNRRRAER